MIWKPTVLIALLALLVFAGCGDDDGEPAKSAAGGGAKAGSEQSCVKAKAPLPKPAGREQKPTSDLDAEKTYRVEFQTSCGTFTVTLDTEGAPNTTASFVRLASTGFYNGTIFHRIVPGFVIQGGDPTGKGTGGPGYKTVDEPPADARYTRGVVAMAKTAAEAPGTAGSQFYVVTGADAGLPPEYAIVGEVTAGMDTVRRIEALGDPNGSELPRRTVVIERATVITG